MKYKVKTLFQLLVVVAVIAIVGSRLINDGNIRGERGFSALVNLFSKKPALKCGLIQPAPGETYDPTSDVVWLTKAWMTAPPAPADKGLTRMVFDGQNLLKGNNKVSVIDVRPRSDGNTALIFNLPVIGPAFSKEGKHALTITLRDTYGRTCSTEARSFKTSRAISQVLPSPPQGVVVPSAARRSGPTSSPATASSCGINNAMYIPYFSGDDQTKVWYSAVQKSADAPKWAAEVNNQFNLNQTFQAHGLLTPTVAISSTPLIPETPPKQGGTGPGWVPVDLPIAQNADGFVRLMDTNGNPWGVGVDLTSAKFFAFAQQLKAQHSNPNEIVAIVVDYIL